MNLDIDDMFKSFVNNKMKQLGMRGSTAHELEKSLQQSAVDKLGKAGNMTEREHCNKKKKKKDKKSKKHKKHKSDKKLEEVTQNSLLLNKEKSRVSDQNFSETLPHSTDTNDASFVDAKDKVTKKTKSSVSVLKMTVSDSVESCKRASKRHHSYHRSRSPKRHRHHHRSSDSKSRKSKRCRSKSPVITAKDKMKLLEIAKANVLAQYQADVTASHLSLESKALLRSGGVTLEHLTGVCKNISEGKQHISNSYKNEEALMKLNHPFQVRELPAISINIKTSIPPVILKSHNDLTKEYPVSCGYQHQCTECFEGVYGKWEPINESKKIEIENQATENTLFENSSENELSIKEVIAQRVNAVRNLRFDPNNPEAVRDLEKVQNQLDSWTSSKLVPGQFTGLSRVQPLTRDELTEGKQAWVNQNSFNSSKQVGGIGRCLLQKMGWKEGESLGKTNLGLIEPLKMQIKTDRKGLSSVMEEPVTVTSFMKKNSENLIVTRDLSGKHPVSAIMEICSKRKWKPPDFVLVQNDGPDHHRLFMFKVMVNGVFYQPSSPSVNKKQAKARAAAAALQALGLIPS